ncbi:MAG: hypothetical protein ACQETQ_10260 [Spirochaetota bacterium]
MKKPVIYVGAVLLMGLFAAAGALAGGSQESVLRTEPFDDGTPVRLHVTEGDHFDHRLEIMPFIRVKNRPQMAAWCESESGEFLATLFVTERTAKRNWRSAPADSTPAEEIRRQESLPVWSSRNTDVHADRNADAVTSATPEEGFELHSRLPAEEDALWFYFEVNHSADFNGTYREDAAKTEATYSGGPWGSGQPALVYGARVERSELSGNTPVTVPLELLGHSSPDGSSSRIYERVDGLSTALDIVERVELTVGGLLHDGDALGLE